MMQISGENENALNQIQKDKNQKHHSYNVTIDNVLQDLVDLYWKQNR